MIRGKENRAFVCPHCGLTFEVADSTDKVIENYYRRKAQNRKITLGDIAQLTGFSEKYLRKCKVAYDAAGKWGSKKAHA